MISVRAKTKGRRVIRVHVTAEDLLRTRFAAGPAPLTELGMALATLQRRDAIFDRWRRELGPRLPRAARLLFQLVPPTAAGPQFLDPVSNGLDDGLDTVLSAATPFVRSELRRVCPADQPITPWVRALNDRDRDAWQELAAAVRAGHQAVVSASWQRVWQSFRADVAWRGRQIAGQGLQAALASLHPAARWNGSTLQIDVASTLVVRPAGRGVTLMPSAFWTGRPMFGTHPDGSALIVYPSVTPLPLIDGVPGEDPLADLLGRTRAAVLALAVGGRTTGELARELGISPATASEHTKTLRAAGLLVSERAGKAVMHSTTPLADRLIIGAARCTPPTTVPTSAATTLEKVVALDRLPAATARSDGGLRT
jgi:DNA-binding transcriptional ArsR family regulator